MTEETPTPPLVEVIEETPTPPLLEVDEDAIPTPPLVQIGNETKVMNDEELSAYQLRAAAAIQE